MNNAIEGNIQMVSEPELLLTLGGVLLLGLVATALGKRTFLPRVTLLLLFGIAVGPEGFSLIPELFSSHFELVADMTLLMVGFLLGGKLTLEGMGGSTRKVMIISAFEAPFTALVVGIVIWLLGFDPVIAIILACISAATAPAAVYDVVLESHSNGPFKKLLLSVVAMDDVWALILFGFGVTIASSMLTSHQDGNALLIAFKEIVGALILGVGLGLPAAYLTGRIKSGEPILSEALGLVFICGGIALWAEISFLIASMAMGATIANLAKHHDYPFHAIEDVEWPLMIIFFVLAGATLELQAVKLVGLLGVVYIISRIVGKITGAWLGAKMSDCSPIIRQWLGSALLPQAGVSVGMALVASAAFPEHRQTLLTVVISATVFFEIIGPVMTRLAIRKTDA